MAITVQVDPVSARAVAAVVHAETFQTDASRPGRREELPAPAGPPGRPGAMSLSSYLLRKALGPRVRRGRLVLVMPSGRRLIFGDGDGDRVVARLTDPAAAWALLLDPDLKTGELFTDGRLVMARGSIYDFISLVLDNDGEASPSPIVRAIDRARTATQLWRQRNDPRRPRRNVGHHADLGDDL